MLKPFSHILFRSPLQPLEQAYRFDKLSNPIFEEGLYLSSPEFWREYNKKENLNEGQSDKLELSFAKYWLRSAARCTPYGTFAGSALVGISADTSEIVVKPVDLHHRSLRLDMNYMAEIVNALLQIKEIRDQVLFVPNNSLYTAAGSFRYAEYSIKDNVRAYSLSSVTHTDCLEKVLRLATQGIKLPDLADALVREEEVSIEEARNYLNELCQSQLLTPQLEPSVTGRGPLDELIAQLEKMEQVGNLVSGFNEIRTLLQNPETGVSFYKTLEAKLAGLKLGVNVPKNTIQADMYLKTTASTLNEGLIAAIAEQVNELKALSRPVFNNDLEEFKNRFAVRYEDRMVPLCEVLDADLGIGYAGIDGRQGAGEEWLAGLAVAGAIVVNNAVSNDHLAQFSLFKYKDWLEYQKDYIEITEEEMNDLADQSKSHKFPDSMFVMGSLMKHGGLLDKDNFKFDVSSFGGPSAANLLGRFAYADAQLTELIKEILKVEEESRPDAVFAEIVHQPQARIGNILLRPVLRGYEIPYVGQSGCEKSKQIKIDELYVAIRHNEIVLFSKCLKKRIIPRLTTAHNFGYNSLPVYKFLCDLQAQGLAYPNVWNWGSLENMKHLPRVVYKNLIVRKALWKFDEKDFTALPPDESEYSTYFRSFRDRFKMPERVVYKEGDNELLIDLDQPMGIKLLLHYLKRYKQVLLEEFLFTEQNSVVRNEQGNGFTNELIIPMYAETKEQARQSVADDGTKVSVTMDVVNEIKRSFAPNSEWLYFKIYCGAQSAEKILTNAILPFVESEDEQKLFEQFFFIRYSDELGSHIRIRFLNTDLQRQLSLYHRFMETLQPYLEKGMISKVMLDTYQRELERYEPFLIKEAETLFFNDSLAVLRFINLLDESDGEQYRILFALRGIDMLLEDFGLTLEQKVSLSKRLQAGFFKEFGAHPFLQKQLNDRYRKHQQFFVGHLNAANDTENSIEEAVAVFAIRSQMNVAIVRKIKAYLNSIDDKDRISDLLVSYVHMFMNRLFIVQQRKYELVAYHFLERYYTSQTAKAKKVKQGVDMYM